jgi:hypothetical protein
MNCRKRLETVFAGGEADRTPILGGWIACPEHICAIAEVSLDDFWADPFGVSVLAYRILGTDGLVSIFVPRSRKDFRCVDKDTYAHAQTALSLEDALARIDAMPSAETIEAEFNLEEAYKGFRNDLVDKQQKCGEMVWMLAQWGAGAGISWYGEFGYENFFIIVAAYPDRARKLVEVGGARGRCRSLLIAKAVREGIYPHAVLLGEDICTQRGPMISPDFMEKYYAPQLRRGLEPLLEVGCKPVWHCDGDVRPLFDMLFDCGVQGLQGFQPECGLTIDYVVTRRTREGKPLLIFGPLAVTTELPFCTPAEVRSKVRYAIEVCRGNANLVLFTGNTINPDVPLANIRAMYDAIHEKGSRK